MNLGQVICLTDCVIILGGKHVKDDNLVKAIDLTLITLFLENGVEVVAAEQSEVPYSSIAHYKTKGITTVDNIETPLGQIASLCFRRNAWSLWCKRNG